ncbi:MAG: YeeE/YedE family protein [Rhodospirillales bacterium]|nr:YeeE/YedE family protein [Rhodospirillales bacterium]
MARVLAALIAGILFGAGLAISQMINPAKVLAFLDVAGDWDPSLAFVMLGAVAVTATGYGLVFRRRRPLFDSGFHVPTRRDIDAKLIFGAAVFGAGWGLAGYCPGPALAGLAGGAAETIVFVAFMAGAMIMTNRVGARWGDLRRPAPSRP